MLTACESNNTISWQEQYDLGVRYLAEGNYEEAIIAFTAAIEIDSKNAVAYVGRGDAYIGLGETEENLALAKNDYETAIELDESNVEAYLGLVDVYIRQGDYEKALEILKQGLEKTNNAQIIADKLAEIEQGEIKDSAGNVRRKNCYGANGELIWYHIITYNESGKYDTMTSFDSAGNQTSHIEFERNGEGELLNDWGYNKDGILHKSINEYDNQGNVIKSTDECGKYTVYEYDDNGRKIKQINYDVEGTMYYGLTFEYNSDGKIVRTDHYVENWERFLYSIYEYNGLGKCSKISTYKPSGELSLYIIYEYDDNGICIEEKHYNADGSLRESIKQ